MNITLRVQNLKVAVSTQETFCHFSNKIHRLQPMILWESFTFMTSKIQKKNNNKIQKEK